MAWQRLSAVVPPEPLQDAAPLLPANLVAVRVLQADNRPAGVLPEDAELQLAVAVVVDLPRRVDEGLEVPPDRRRVDAEDRRQPLGQAAGEEPVDGVVPEPSGDSRPPLPSPTAPLGVVPPPPSGASLDRLRVRPRRPKQPEGAETTGTVCPDRQQTPLRRPVRAESRPCGDRTPPSAQENERLPISRSVIESPERLATVASHGLSGKSRVECSLSPSGIVDANPGRRDIIVERPADAAARPVPGFLRLGTVCTNRQRKPLRRPFRAQLWLVSGPIPPAPSREYACRSRYRQ